MKKLLFLLLCAQPAYSFNLVSSALCRQAEKETTTILYATCVVQVDRCIENLSREHKDAIHSADDYSIFSMVAAKKCILAAKEQANKDQAAFEKKYEQYRVLLNLPKEKK